MKIGDKKGGMGVLYKEVVVTNSSSREKVWFSTIVGDKMDMGEGNSSVVKVEVDGVRGGCFLGNKGGIGKKVSIK